MQLSVARQHSLDYHYPILQALSNRLNQSVLSLKASDRSTLEKKLHCKLVDSASVELDQAFLVSYLLFASPMPSSSHKSVWLADQRELVCS